MWADGWVGWATQPLFSAHKGVKRCLVGGRETEGKQPLSAAAADAAAASSPLQLWFASCSPTLMRSLSLSLFLSISLALSLCHTIESTCVGARFGPGAGQGLMLLPPSAGCFRTFSLAL